MARFAANLTFLFTELPMLDRFAAAKAAGFDGAEVLFPYDLAARELSLMMRTCQGPIPGWCCVAPSTTQAGRLRKLRRCALRDTARSS